MLRFTDCGDTCVEIWKEEESGNTESNRVVGHILFPDAMAQRTTTTFLVREIYGLDFTFTELEVIAHEMKTGTHLAKFIKEREGRVA